MYTVTSYLLSRLAELGVGHIFGVPGDYNMPMLDVVESHPHIRWIGTANELNAAYAADGYARIRGIGALITTFGVGELSALNAIAGAYAESVPVVHIVGAPATAVQNAGAFVHHTLADGDFKRFTRMAAEVTAAQADLTIENAVQEIDRVLSVALQTRKPVHIVVPVDIGSAHIAVPRHRSNLHAARNVDPLSLARFRQRARQMLMAATDIGALGGHLVDRFGGRDMLRRIVNVPNVRGAVVSSAKGLLDEAHPHFAGLYAGGISDEATRASIEDADVIITAGVVLADTVTGGFTHDLPMQRRIDLGAETANISGTVFEGVPLRDALVEIHNILTQRSMARAIAPSSERGGHAALAVAAHSERITPELFWQQLRVYLRPGDMVFADQGTSFYGGVTMPLPSGADLIGQPIWASIGYTLPAMLGAQLADPSRRAVLVIGDGAAQMTIQELGTFIRYGLRPLIVILNNDGYTIERAIHNPDASYHNIARWKWTEIPAAFGAQDNVMTLSAKRFGELQYALSVASMETRMTMLEVHVGAMERPQFMDRFAAALAKQNESRAEAAVA